MSVNITKVKLFILEHTLFGTALTVSKIFPLDGAKPQLFGSVNFLIYGSFCTVFVSCCSNYSKHFLI